MATLTTTSAPTRVTKAKRSTFFQIIANIVTTGIVTIQTLIRAFAVTIVTILPTQTRRLEDEYDSDNYRHDHDSDDYGW